MANVPQTLKGFRDFLPKEKRARDYIISKIIPVFRMFGFDPLETPTLEYASLLTGKYGDEADKLLYTFTDRGDRQVGLRYDQTVPTARVLAQYQHELPKYFRRYQISNVFRADKPQKGRFREFTQCDIDIFGSTSALADAEIIACSYLCFRAVGFTEFTIKINDRETLLSTLEPFASKRVPVFSIIQSIDKLDKMSEAAVISELSEKGLGLEKANAALSAIKTAPISKNSASVIAIAESLGVPSSAIKVSPTLARGLDYYTGTIFEISVPAYPMGSFAGGGRYDNLIKQLGGPSVPAVGIAFGFDRMVTAATELGLVPTSINQSAQVLVTVFDEASAVISAKIAASIRQVGFSTELYPAIDKLGKQLKYADQKSIPVCLVIGPEEQKQKIIAVKDLSSGKQKMIPQTKLISTLNQMLNPRSPSSIDLL